MTEPLVYAWTPGQGAYKFYPQYANFKVWQDGRCVVTVRGPEFRTVGQPHYEMGETICIQLPPDAAAELGAFLASAIPSQRADDAEGGSAGTEGSAVAKPDAQTPIPSSRERK